VKAVKLDKLLQQLVAQQDELQFAQFTFDDAYAIGVDLVETARNNGLKIAIDIAKNRVVGRFFTSSYYIAKLLESHGRSIEEAYGLSANEFAPFGGAVPITVKGTGVIGCITVSGLPDEEDHRTVVDAIGRHMGRTGEAGRKRSPVSSG